MYVITRSNYYLIRNPINCSRLKTCPDGAIISVCQQCKYYKPYHGNKKPTDICAEFKTCPDGSIISKCEKCPPTKTCPNGIIMPVNAPCPNEYPTSPNQSQISNITSEIMNFINKYKHYIIVFILIILLILIFSRKW